MLLCCLKCRNKTESKDTKVVTTKKEERCFHENVQCEIVKNHDLLKSNNLWFINWFIRG